VRFFAGRSFALYLFHYPILLGLHAALLRFRPGVSPVWELPVMTAAVLAVAEVTERRKSVWQRWFGK
jgi:peptidoglycan/LPS O-acetylase OafA/YrhL